MLVISLVIDRFTLTNKPRIHGMIPNCCIISCKSLPTWSVVGAGILVIAVAVVVVAIDDDDDDDADVVCGGIGIG